MVNKNYTLVVIPFRRLEAGITNAIAAGDPSMSSKWQEKTDIGEKRQFVLFDALRPSPARTDVQGCNVNYVNMTTIPGYPGEVNDVNTVGK